MLQLSTCASFRQAVECSYSDSRALAAAVWKRNSFAEAHPNDAAHSSSSSMEKDFRNIMPRFLTGPDSPTALFRVYDIGWD